MLTAITEKTRIDGLQKRLTKKLVEGGIPRTIDYGHRGEKVRGNKAWWYQREKFWWCYHPPEGQSWWRHRVPEAGLTRHWNGFGHAEECHDGKEYSITCEINFKREHDWTVAGTFARDEDDVVYIVHTGKIGGGRKGVSMKLFKQKYVGSGQWMPIRKDGKIKDAVVISDLDDPDLLSHIGLFVREVRRIKNLEKNAAPPPTLTSRMFNREHEGQRAPFRIRNEIRANVKHGHVVASLQKRAADIGLETWNTQATDLFLKGEKTAMIEVKTNQRPYSKYEAIGQLLYHGRTNQARNMVLVAVFPDIDRGFKNVLERLGIIGITYSLTGSRCKFNSALDDVLNNLRHGM